MKNEENGYPFRIQAYVDQESYYKLKAVLALKRMNMSEWVRDKMEEELKGFKFQERK